MYNPQDTRSQNPVDGGKALLRVYAIFHLNLAYSSIEHHQREEVLENCYWPLLHVAEELSVPIGIEASGYTLENIARLDPRWIDTLSRLLRRGVCDFIGSGYAQIAAPIVPAKVNVANIKLGADVYRDLLGVVPEIAFVSEQAFSTGLVGVFKACRIRALVMDWDNPAMFNTHWDPALRYAVQRVGDGSGAELDLLWNSSIAFQQFQRYVAGEMTIEDYIEIILRHRGNDARIWPLYGNDVEVFGFRPKRYLTETPLQRGEWDRIRALFVRLRGETSIEIVTPAQVLAAGQNGVSALSRLQLTTAECPVPVKKQPKYNISRWAVTGRDDLWLNTACHRLARRLAPYDGETDREHWRHVCRAWSSDYRTHITPLRWQSALDELQELASRMDQILPAAPGDLPPIDGAQWRVADRDGENFSLRVDVPRQLLTMETAHATIVVNLRRGLAIHSAAFGTPRRTPIIGTLPHGYFDSIDLGADFYTGSIIVELLDERRRLTDLMLVAPQIFVTSKELICDAVVDTDKGSIHKRIAVGLHAPAMRYEVGFPNWQRPMGTVRVGHVTLCPQAFSGPLRYTCLNGGMSEETFRLDRSFNHAAPVSTLVSCTTGLGATDGRIVIGDETRAVELSWAPWQCAAFPMIFHRESAPSSLTRVIFSLCELDETSREGGHLLPFSLGIREVGV